jgi:hypothetical protein
MLTKKTYFVTSHHEMAKPMIQLLTDRLDDSGWSITLSKLSATQVYTKPRLKTRYILSTVSVQSAGGQSVAHMVGPKYCSLAKYLEAEQKLADADAVLQQIVTVHEHKYMLPGSAQHISFLASEAGVYLSANCTKQMHTVLSEYYKLSDDPEALYSAIDENGDLWELTDADSESGDLYD